MNTKEKLLQLFELNRGKYFSGEELAGMLNVSRTAVWKAVKNLRTSGYEIAAVTNKGYSLSEKTDILSPQGICRYLNDKNMDIQVVSTINSTNLYARERAVEGEEEGYVIFANQQTKGRGRFGREFFSPAGTGIYMSIILRPVDYAATQAVRITALAAIAMCEVIESLSGKSPGIKWVNDIYVDGKKVCGILTEGSFDLETNTLEYAVLGVGINLYPPYEGFPCELEDKVGCLFDSTETDMKNKLAGDFINRFMDYYKRINCDDQVEKYKKYSLVLDKEIYVIKKGYSKKCIGRDIDKDYHLIVQYEDGLRECLYSGEISLKLE